ncbi:MAG: hypothetical protein ABIQ18_04035 [Umezawaea sp.]
MDHVNHFDTKATYWIMRAEYLAGFAVCVVLLLLHFGDVRWWAAIVLFFSIDIIGYYPGAIAFKRAGGGRIHKGYYIVYNTMHNWFAATAIVGLWMLVAGPEWALLAIPLHLCADRGLLGNTLKPFSLAFEPEPMPAFQAFIAQVTGKHYQTQVQVLRAEAKAPTA